MSVHLTPVVAMIPTIGRSTYLLGLLQRLQLEDIAVRLMVNEGTTPSEVARYKELTHWGAIDLRPGCSIYQEMNEAADWACSLDAHLLVLNDDIQIPSGFGRCMGEALDRHPGYGLISTNMHRPHPIAEPGGGVTPAGFRSGDRRAFANWAFIARPEAWQKIGDFKIWYGDDHLISQVEAAGWGVGYLSSVGVYHDTSTTARQLPWVNDAIVQDQALWAQIGGR